VLVLPSRPFRSCTHALTQFGSDVSSPPPSFLLLWWAFYLLPLTLPCMVRLSCEHNFFRKDFQTGGGGSRTFFQLGSLILSLIFGG